MKHVLPPISLGSCLTWLPLSAGAAELLCKTIIEGPQQPSEDDWAQGIALDPALAGWLIANHAKRGPTTDPPTTISQLAKLTHAAARNGQLISDLVWSPPETPTNTGVPTSPIKWDTNSLFDDMIHVVGGTPCLAELTKIARRWLRDQSGQCPLENENCGVSGSNGDTEEDNTSNWYERVWPQPTNELSSLRDHQPGDWDKLRQHWADDVNGDLRSFLPTIAAKLTHANAIESNFDDALEQAKLNAMKELAYGASHEINNPLANISARAQTLLAEETDPDRQKALAAINRQSFRAHEMIADMMLFAHPPRVEYSEFAMADLIDEVIIEFTPDCERQGTTVLRTSPSGHGPQLVVEADRVQIGVAIKALVRNAMEALAAGGTVKVEAASTEIEGGPQAGIGLCIVSISDDGPGISDEIRQHMFEPFYSGREAGRGLGFGLSKVWRIAEQHGGSVAVSQIANADQTKPRTCISVNFPLRQIPLDASDSDGSLASTSANPSHPTPDRPETPPS